MSGYELLISKMKELGATKAQTESKIVEMVVSIMAENFETADSRIGLLRDIEEEYKRKAEECEAAKEEYRQKIMEESRKAHNLLKVRDIFDDVMSDIRDMYNELTEAETPSARDRIRTAKIYESKVTVKTCYDNTAYIKGLSAILSGQPLPDEDLPDDTGNTGKERKKLHYNEVIETVSERLEEAKSILSDYDVDDVWREGRRI